MLPFQCGRDAKGGRVQKGSLALEPEIVDAADCDKKEILRGVVGEVLLKAETPEEPPDVRIVGADEAAEVLGAL